MQTGLAGLALWSFLMATAHGAGLMLWPALMPLCIGWRRAGLRTVATALAGVGVHTLAMLMVTAAIAIVSTSGSGRVLRHAWINVDLVWTAALIAAGVTLLVISVVDGVARRTVARERPRVARRPLTAARSSAPASDRRDP